MLPVKTGFGNGLAHHGVGRVFLFAQYLHGAKLYYLLFERHIDHRERAAAHVHGARGSFVAQKLKNKRISARLQSQLEVAVFVGGRSAAGFFYKNGGKGQGFAGTAGNLAGHAGSPNGKAAAQQQRSQQEVSGMHGFLDVGDVQRKTSKTEFELAYSRN